MPRLGQLWLCLDPAWILWGVDTVRRWVQEPGSLGKISWTGGGRTEFWPCGSQTPRQSLSIGKNALQCPWHVASAPRTVCCVRMVSSLWPALCFVRSAGGQGKLPTKPAVPAASCLGGAATKMVCCTLPQSWCVGEHSSCGCRATALAVVLGSYWLFPLTTRDGMSVCTVSCLLYQYVHSILTWTLTPASQLC